MAAETILFSLCSMVLFCISKKAYKKGFSICEARDELRRLEATITTIQAKLTDVEKKQALSAHVNNWIHRFKGVLYDALDLFDEVATEDLLKEHMIEGRSHICGCEPGTGLLSRNINSLENQVLVCCTSIVTGNSIADRVRNIRKSLDEISSDLSRVQSMGTENNGTQNNTRRDCTHSVSVFGRVDDKETIKEMLSIELSPTTRPDAPVVVIAIVGIGGMGKSTLAHWIYNDEMVKKMFEGTWFARISKTDNDEEIFRIIYQSIFEKSHRDLTITQIQDEIKEFTKGKKYLLILDDVWDSHHGSWRDRMGVFKGARGSRIIVTTRLPSVGRSMSAVRTHRLSGLSDDDSLSLFESLAFESFHHIHKEQVKIGKELLERCRGVPLAIWSTAALLHGKHIAEWRNFQSRGPPKLGAEEVDETMSRLRLSYDHLPSDLKQCFTYCSLFPRGYRYKKDELINHWVAQGYLDPLEAESGFMMLLDMGIFQDEQKDGFGSIHSCKMHDILHDLASYLADKEYINVVRGTSQSMSSYTRFASLMADDEENAPQNIPESLLIAKSLRSCLLSRSSFVGSQPNLKKLFSSFKVLRTLKLSGLGIEDIPPSIGELKLVRYLDLSSNNFKTLPGSITNLVNLLILNLESCSNLREWPPSFKKLVKLWSLNFKNCDELNLMPEGIGEIAGLRYLSDFRVGTSNELGVLNGLLKQLGGDLSIRFCGGVNFGDEWMLELPPDVSTKKKKKLPADVSLRHLDMSSYPGQTIRYRRINECTSELERLHLTSCENLSKLEFLAEEEVDTNSNATSKRSIFPCLEELQLDNMPNLSQLLSKLAAETTCSSTPIASSVLEFSRLSKLRIVDCEALELNSFPSCKYLRELHLQNVGNNTPKAIQDEMLSTIFCSSSCPSIEKIVLHNCKWLSIIPGQAFTSLRELDIQFCCSLTSLKLASPQILDIKIEECDKLVSIEVVQSPKPSLKFLRIKRCRMLKSLLVDTYLGASLELMEVADCPKLRLSNAQGKRSPKEIIMGNQGFPEAGTRRLVFQNVDNEFTQWWLSSLSMRSLEEIIISGCISLPGVELISLQQCQIEEADGLGSLHIPSPHLRHPSFKNCVDILYCPQLKNLRIARPNALEEASIFCISSAGLDWNSIPKLSERRCVRKMELGGVDGVFLERFLSSSSLGSVTVALASLEELSIEDIHGLKNLNFISQNLTEAASSSTPSASEILEFSCLSKLSIKNCPNLELKSFPSCTCLRELHLEDVGNYTSPLIQHEMLPTIFGSSHCSSIEKIVLHNCKWLSIIHGDALTSLRELDIQFCCSLRSLHLASVHLLDVKIVECDELTSIEVVQEPSLPFLKIKDCKQLKSSNVSLEKMEITNCPELRFSVTQNVQVAVA